MLNILRTLFLITALLAVPLCHAQTASAQYEAGKHYEVLQKPVLTSDPKRIEVIELFWYGCPHCYHFEPSLKPWIAALPKDVNFQRMPAMWSDEMITHAKIFYTARQFNKLDAMHDSIFTAMQVEKKRLTDENEIADLFSKFGVSQKAFSSTFNSFIVDAAARQAADRGRDYGLTGTPMLVINGKYTISASPTVSQEDMLKIASFLIDKERKAMKTGKKQKAGN